MKVKNGNILIDNESIDLDNVAMIDVAKVDSKSDEPKFALSFVYKDATSKTIASTVDTDKVKLYRQLNKLGKEIIRAGNDNYANIGIAVINMNYIDSILYSDDYKFAQFYSRGEYIKTIWGTTKQLKRASAKVDAAFDEFYHSRNQRLQ